MNVSTNLILELKDKLNIVTQERDMAVGMLAYWVAQVNNNGTQWDDWDEGFKDAAYRDCGIRHLLDAAIIEANKYWKET